MRTHLRRQGMPAQRVEAQVRAFRAMGLLDDRAAARLWADHWARRGYAAAAIHAKLSQKGFSDACIRSTLNQHDRPADDESRARTWLAQRPRSGSSSSPRSRLARALASRGFDAELIERLLGESGESD